MGMARLFGTDGVRGVAGTELTCELAYELGRAGAAVLTEGTHRPTILVGRDTRISGTMLESALAAGICSVGAAAVLVGVIPTPGIAWLTRTAGADAGVVISASHNPMEFNGIKFFNREGYKLPDAVEDAIEAHVRAGGAGLPRMQGADVGTVTAMDNAAALYMEHLRSLVREDISRYKVVLDCANGAASAIAPQVFAQLGCDVTAICNQPDGCNINRDCGSTHMEGLAKAVVEHGADIGLAFDGDADRLLAVDEKGNLVDGDKIMLICAQDLRRQGRLKQDTVVTTVMSNLGMTLAAKELGIQLARTAVGDRYVLEYMMEHGCSLGGEQSGHIIFLDDNTTGDGLCTALRLTACMAASGAPLSRLAEIMEVLPQVLVNVRVDNAKKNGWEKDPVIVQAIAEVTARYDGRGTVLVRASGTEPLVRVMMEGTDREAIARDAEMLGNLIKTRLN